eukprot:COSAG06_NODE_3248_length_5619_cov_32.539493_6_plen_193_part_00
MDANTMLAAYTASVVGRMGKHTTTSTSELEEYGRRWFTPQQFLGAKGDTYKATTPNPKCEILHMSLDSDNVVTVQVSEPIMLSTWQHNFAIGPSDYGLFLTVSPDWRKTLLFDHSGQYGCGSAGAIINGNNSTAPRQPVQQGTNASKLVKRVDRCYRIGKAHCVTRWPPSLSAAISHFEAHWTILDGVGEAT